MKQGGHSEQFVMMALVALVSCGQECGGPGPSKDLTPGEDHPPILKEGHDCIISLLGSIYPALTVCTHGATSS